MSKRLSLFALFGMAAILSTVFSNQTHAQAPVCQSLTAGVLTYNQNFDTLANTGTSSTVPAGFGFAETGTSNNATYSAGTGSGNGGDTYSFGAASATDRAFGGLLSGSLVPTIGACFTNNTGSAITGFSVTYDGEQWRLGNSGRVDRLDFQYSTNATTLLTGTYTDFDALDFNAPISTGTVGALDGNAAANRIAGITSMVSSLTIANGATFYIRYSDFNASGADDGLGIDNFSLTAILAAPAAPTITNGNTATFVVGQAGTFTVTTSGSPVSAITLTGGTLPTGLTFTDNGNGTATITGTPASGTNGSYSLVFTASNGVNPDATQNFTLIVDLAPTAAGTTAGGRVTESNGRGIFRALVTMTDSQGSQRQAYTNQQGFYTFENVPGGQVYVFTAMHRRYLFEQPTQVQFIGEEENGINFIGTTNGFFRQDFWNIRTKGNQ